MGNQE